MLCPHSLSLGEFELLATLRRDGPPFRRTPTSLTADLMMTSGGMTKRLGALERGGLIRRVPDPADGRSKLVELTDEGRQVVEQVLAIRLKHEKRVLAALRKKQRRDLASALRDLCVALGDEPASQPRRNPGRTTS